MLLRYFLDAFLLDTHRTMIRTFVAATTTTMGGCSGGRSEITSLHNRARSRRRSLASHFQDEWAQIEPNFLPIISSSCTASRICVLIRARCRGNQRPNQVHLALACGYRPSTIYVCTCEMRGRGGFGDMHKTTIFFCFLVCLLPLFFATTE